MRRILKWLAIAGGALLAVAVLYLLTRVVFYRQVDDPEHVATKQAYLARVAGLTGGSPKGPNFVVILFDDLGYGDVGAYGSRAIRTPHMDGLAGEGARLTQAYSASPYCSGSRAGPLTGRYPARAGLDHVVQPRGTVRDVGLRLAGMNRRLPAEEVTLSEVLSAAGYATGIFGKWHLGDHSPSLPNDRGFDTFYGLLHSNGQGKPVVWRDRQVVEGHPIDQESLTRRYTERAVAFIEANRDRPFFLYLPHTFPHIPLHASPERRGTSEAGLYGDVVEELDDSVGTIVESLERLGLERRTLVVLTSDNGPWFQGSPGGTRGRKLDIFEGGMRVPFIAYWPGRIPPGRVIDKVVMGIDLFPTVLELAGLPPPEDRVLDGESLVGLLEGRDSLPQRAVYFYQLGALKAVRRGGFKYHDRHGIFYGNPMDWSWGPMKRRGPWLFNLAVDPDESYDVSLKHPEVARGLRELMEERNREMARNSRGWR